MHSVRWDSGWWMSWNTPPQKKKNEADHGKIGVVTGSGWAGPLRLQRLKFQFVLW